MLVVFSTNKTDRRDITKIVLKVVLNTITLTLNAQMYLKKNTLQIVKQ